MSVRLSYAGILSKWINVSSYLSLGSHTILVFPHQTAWHIPTGTAKGVIECRGVLKTAVFGEYLNFLSEMIQDIIIVTMQCE